MDEENNQDEENRENQNFSPDADDASTSSSSLDVQSNRDYLHYVISSEVVEMENNSEPELNNDDDDDELFENYIRENNNRHLRENIDDGHSENVERFDIELPGEHSYFGTTENVSGVNYLEPNKIYRIPICTHNSLVYPGETFPMLMTEFYFNGLDKTNDGLVFGLLFPSIWPQTKPKMYGVTCQIYEKGNDGRGNVTIKSRVYQRFIVVTPDNDLLLRVRKFFQGGRASADVKILPEIVQESPLNCFTNNLTRNKQKKFQYGLTTWPQFVYDQYDWKVALEKIKKYLATMKIESMPNDPTLLSFWLGRNIPLETKDKTSIFLTNSITQRILFVGKCLNYFCYFGCVKCEENIANYNDLFAMSKHGIQSNYCNPAGYVHETLTIYKTRENSIYMTDRPSTEFSWFPGYAWQIANCKNCHHHLGWRFSSVKPNMIPRIFFGLAGNNIFVGTNKNLKDDDDE